MIELINVKKSYLIKTANELAVLKGISININQGEFVSIMGASGSGKSTLLNLIGCLDTLSTGKYFFLNKDISSLNAKKISIIRRQYIGFVFQSFSLISNLTAYRNIELPLIYAGVSTKKRSDRVYQALKTVNLLNRENHLPSQLSGGQQQRIAIARALVNKPKLIVADEPTGSLDSKNGNEIMNLFKGLNDEGVTILMVTHDKQTAEFSKRVITLRDGKIIS